MIRPAFGAMWPRLLRKRKYLEIQTHANGGYAWHRGIGCNGYQAQWMGLTMEHRLTKPRTPKTNSMVERFNGRISDVLKTNRFDSPVDLEHTLLRYVVLYKHQLPQSALKNKTPIQTMKGWYDFYTSLMLRRENDFSQ